MLFANYLVRFFILVLYLAAAMGTAAGLSEPAAYWVRLAVLATLLAHAGELAIFLPRVRRYQGPLALSVALTMLFGLLHWAPLKPRTGN